MDQSEIEQAICDVINEICFWINAEEIELNQPLGSMNIDTDEWSFEIIPALEKKSGCLCPQTNGVRQGLSKK